MKKIYIKNFKGFVEQIIEFEEVNFLVGENSTGKTSIINLINLLSSQEFWFNGQFNNGEIELGYFEEVLSKNAVEKTFQIGIERNEIKVQGKSKTNRIVRILFQFKSEKSRPKIDWIRLSVNDLNVHISFLSKKIEFKYYYSDFQSFDSWIKSKVKKEPVGGEFNFPAFNFPLPILFQLINSKIKQDSNSKEDKIHFEDGSLYSNYTYLAPIRAKAKRIYESYNIKFSPEGDHIPSLLKSLLANVKNKQKTLQILERFGKESNLFDSIEINELGDKNISPFEILVKYNKTPIKLTNVGYGVSQILPLIIEMLAKTKATFSIQQPEVHLHPKAQSAFGSFLYKACINEGHGFIIETHSDFTINRFRYSLSKSQKEKNVSSQVLFFERRPDGNMITTIKINSDGSYQNEMPEAYRDFFIDEELKLLEL